MRDGGLRVRTRCFTNLALLGFEELSSGDAKSPGPGSHAVTGCEDAQNKRAVPATGSLFAKDLSARDAFFSSNPTVRFKAVEAAIWFLHWKLDAQETGVRFAHCWPILDRAVGREFRNVVYKWLEALKKSGHIPWDVAVRRSYLDECKGERFDELMLSLSNYVVEVVLERDFAPDFAPACSVPVGFANPEHQAELASMLRLSIQLEMDRAAEAVRRELENEESYNILAEKITNLWLACEEKQEEVSNLRNALKCELAVPRNQSRQEPPMSTSIAHTTCLKNRGLADLSDNHIEDFGRLDTRARLQAQQVENVWLDLLTWLTKSSDRRGVSLAGLLQELSPCAGNDRSFPALLPTFRLSFVDIMNLICNLLLAGTSAAVPECAYATLETVRNQRKITRATIQALRKRLLEAEDRAAARSKDLELRRKILRSSAEFTARAASLCSPIPCFSIKQATACYRSPLCDANPTARLSGAAVSSTLRASIEKIRAEIREHASLAFDKRTKAVPRTFPS